MLHYLDNSATTRVLPEATQAALRVMEEDFGNPSSQHRMGVRAAHILKEARAAVAGVLGAKPEEVFFTSGGTESTNTALFGACQKNRRFGKHIITSAIEHSATLNSVRQLVVQGFTATYLKPDAQGQISVADFTAALQEDTIAASIMVVNNEVGSVLPVQEMGAVLKRRCPNAIFHVDAVQGLFRVPLTPAKWNCDLLSVSGHKIGAPKGIGALYKKGGVRIPPLLYGGGQEQGFRPGTEPLPAIAAFGVACQVRADHLAADTAHIAGLCEQLQTRMQAELPFAVQNGKNDIPHVLNYSFEGCKSEVLLRVLESEEVYVSAGSACARGHESHVLKAMGLQKQRIDTALRISFAPFNTKEDIDCLIAAVQKGAARLRR